jgi:predicted ABC-type ATPase
MGRNSDKKIVIIAGPNGAGKTTFAREYLPNEIGCPVFVNADLIAAGLEPFRPELAAIRAGRLMLKEIQEHFRLGHNFAFETTLSGLAYSRLIPLWRKHGYNVKLIFLQLPNVEFAIARVAVRVKQGGHSVAGDTIRRRFFAGQKNFRLIYRHIVNSWAVYDNSGEVPKLVEDGDNL